VIKIDIDKKEDLKLVNREIWEFLFKLYRGGPEIVCDIITSSDTKDKKLIEIYLKFINCLFLPKELTEEAIDGIVIKPLYYSASYLLNDLKTKIASIGYGVKDFNKTRLWKLNEKVGYDELIEYLKSRVNTYDKEATKLAYLECKLKTNSDIKDLQINDLDVTKDNIIVIEFYDKEGQNLFKVKEIEAKCGQCPKCQIKQILHYPSECKCILYCSKKCSFEDYYIHMQSCEKEKEKLTIEKSSDSKLGLVGLINIGNTCFMNTAIQCISNCWELTNYFLRNYYKGHINIVNPIGTNGILAKKYANLIKHLWYGTEGIYLPIDLKNAIGHFNSSVTYLLF
jgi:hypothetical protein